MKRQAAWQEEGEEMLRIISNISDNVKQETHIDYSYIKKAAQSALREISNEVPEEYRTVEVVEYIISEMSEMLKSAKIIL